MRFSVLTIFPEMFELFQSHGIIKRAIEAGKISVSAIDIRDFTEDRHRTTDDRPYGGGCGMVMKPEPLAAAIREAKQKAPAAKVVALSPQGVCFDQALSQNYAGYGELILVCGRYEGIDDRIYETFIDEEVSIGDYILTGGELPAMVLMDAVTRLIPGTLGGADSAEKDSFADNLLEHAHYTRPASFENQQVPEVLLSGNHKAIESWRAESALIRTFLKRPDLLKDRVLSDQEMTDLEKWHSELIALIDVNRDRT